MSTVILKCIFSVFLGPLSSSLPYLANQGVQIPFLYILRRIFITFNPNVNTNLAHLLTITKFEMEVVFNQFFSRFIYDHENNNEWLFLTATSYGGIRIWSNGFILLCISNSLGCCYWCYEVGKKFLFFYFYFLLLISISQMPIPEFNWGPSPPLCETRRTIRRWLPLAACATHRVPCSLSAVVELEFGITNLQQPRRVFPGPCWICVMAAGNPKALNPGTNLVEEYRAPHEVNLALSNNCLGYSVNEVVLYGQHVRINDK